MSRLQKLHGLRVAAEAVFPPQAGHDINDVIFVPLDAVADDDRLPDITAFLHALGQKLNLLGEDDAYACLMGKPPRAASWATRASAPPHPVTVRAW